MPRALLMRRYLVYQDVCDGMKHLSAQGLVYHYTGYFCRANGSRGHLRAESALIQASRTGNRDVITGKMEERSREPEL